MAAHAANASNPHSHRHALRRADGHARRAATLVLRGRRGRRGGPAGARACCLRDTPPRHASGDRAGRRERDRGARSVHVCGATAAVAGGPVRLAGLRQGPRQQETEARPRSLRHATRRSPRRARVRLEPAARTARRALRRTPLARCASWLAGELYAKLRVHADARDAELNIEGAVVHGDSVRLLQRGNGKHGSRPWNAILDLALEGFRPLARQAAWTTRDPAHSRRGTWRCRRRAGRILGCDGRQPTVGWHSSPAPRTRPTCSATGRC